MDGDEVVKKLFGGIDLTWKKVIISAVIVAIYTALVAIIPIFKYTSFYTIAVTFEVWILFGIIIIMNSKSNKDSALKCFVFFLISQPLIYLIQVPFSNLGWGLFGYYQYWFIWTLLCLPMGYIGYYMKKDKWWGYLILLPMILFLGESYGAYLSDFMFSYPRYLLISLFCIITMIIYPLYIFNNKKIRLVGVIISILIILAITVNNIINPPVYKTTLALSDYGYKFDDTYKVKFTDKKYGSVNIVYYSEFDEYLVEANFKRGGKAILQITSPDNSTKEFIIDIKRNTYDIKER